MKYKTSHIVKTKQTLASLPAISIESKDQVTPAEAIALLADELSALRKKGYTTSLLCKVLQDQGIDVSEATLLRYMRRAGVSSPRKRQKNAEAVRPPAKTGQAAAGGKSKAPVPLRMAQPDTGAATKSSKFPVRGDTDEL